MEQVLDRLIDDFHERALPDLVRRDQTIPEVAGKAAAVIGMRRAGKTWLCYQKMKDLLAGGVAKQRLLYINFEDERMLPFSTTDFQKLLETFFRKSPSLRDTRCYLFLDEPQRIEGWDTFVRRVLDTENIWVVVTGSSSKLLSAEIATSLRGRSLATEVFPFSFEEFLRFHDVSRSASGQYGSRMRSTLQHMAGRYLNEGGFPEVQGLEPELRRQIMLNYIDLVILRDVVERHAVTNTETLRRLIRHVMGAPSTRFSVNKFFDSLRSQGVSCTKNLLYDYLAHLQEAFLLYAAPIHVRSAKARDVNPRKAYVIDTGMLQAMSFHLTEDRGALLENLVFMHLRRQGLAPEYYVTKKGAEVDLVIPASHAGDRRLVQVTWTLGQEPQRKREVGALFDAMAETGIPTGTIVTWLEEDRIDDRIDVVPAWKWLLPVPPTVSTRPSRRRKSGPL